MIIPELPSPVGGTGAVGTSIPLRFKRTTLGLGAGTVF